MGLAKTLRGPQEQGKKDQTAQRPAVDLVSGDLVRTLALPLSLCEPRQGSHRPDLPFPL